ncbi:MAG: hypothetical protein FWH03_04600 [Firmicutes bacterium]|nr:hypothetical protein [Bacillota bacterium]
MCFKRRKKNEVKKGGQAEKPVSAHEEEAAIDFAVAEAEVCQQAVADEAVRLCEIAAIAQHDEFLGQLDCEDVSALAIFGAEEEPTEEEISGYLKEEEQHEEELCADGTKAAMLAACEEKAACGEIELDEEVRLLLEQAEKERAAFITAKKTGKKAVIPALNFTLSREDVIDYIQDMAVDGQRFPIIPVVLNKKKKHHADPLYCGKWCFGLLYERAHVIRLILRADEAFGKSLEEKYTAVKRTRFFKSNDWYNVIVDASFGTKKEVYDIIEKCYAYVLNRYYQNVQGKFITDEAAAALDTQCVKEELPLLAQETDPAYETAIQEHDTALETFCSRNKPAFHMTRKRMLLFAKRRLSENGEAVERAKRFLPTSLKAGAKTYALVYEKVCWDMSDPAAKGKSKKAQEAKKNLSLYVSLTVRISDAYAEWLALRHPEVRRAGFPKNRNWYIVPIRGSFRNAQMVYRVLRRAKNFVTKK